MRTDARIDRKQVYLPCASTLGFDKWKAQFGDIVVFHDGDNSHVGRVAGRIAYAPAIEPNEQPIKNWLLVIVLDSSLTFVMERWIDPKQVMRCYTPTVKQVNLLEFMFLPSDFKKQTPDELREWSESGFATFEEFEEYKAKLIEVPNAS